MHLFLWAFFREFLSNCLLGTGIFSLFFFFGESSRLLELALLVSGQRTAVFLRSLCFLYAKYWLSVSGFIVPMAMLFGVALTISRMQEDRELLAMASLGAAIHRSLTFVALLLGCVASYLMAPLIHEIIPKTKLSIKSFAYEGTRLDNNFHIEPKTWIDLTNAQIYAASVHGNKMEDVVIYARRSDGGEGDTRADALYKVTGEKASYQIAVSTALNAPRPQAQLLLNIERGHLEYPDRLKSGNTTICRFQTYENSIPLRIESTPEPGVREYTSSELRRKILAWAQDYEENQKNLSAAKTEISTRGTLALSPISLTLISSIITLRLDKKSKGFGFGLSLALLGSYWIVLVLASTVGMPGIANPLYIGLGLFLNSLIK
ncbi:MAG: LptF/LptG family permease [Elusimicrobiota bacterium]